MSPDLPRIIDGIVKYGELKVNNLISFYIRTQYFGKKS